MPQDYQSVLTAACCEANVDMLAKYDALNPPALRRLVANGVSLRPFPREVTVACYKATLEVYDETMAKNAAFRKIYEPWKKFRDEAILWMSVCERNFDDFMIGAARTASSAPAKKYAGSDLEMGSSPIVVKHLKWLTRAPARCRPSGSGLR